MIREDDAIWRRNRRMPRASDAGKRRDAIAKVLFRQRDLSREIAKHPRCGRGTAAQGAAMVEARNL